VLKDLINLALPWNQCNLIDYRLLTIESIVEIAAVNTARNVTMK